MLCLKRWNLSTQDITILTERYQTSLCHLKPAFTILIFNCSWTQFFKTKYPRAIIELQIPILTTTQHTDLCLTFKREEKSGLTNQLTSYIIPMCFSRPDSVKQQQQTNFSPVSQHDYSTQFKHHPKSKALLSTHKTRPTNLHNIHFL